MAIIRLKESLDDKSRLERFLAKYGEDTLGKKMTLEEFLEWMKGYDSLVLVMKGGPRFRRYNSKRKISEKERQNRVAFARRMYEQASCRRETVD